MNQDLRTDNREVVIYNVEDIKRIFKIGNNKAYALLSSRGFPSFRLNKRLYVTKDNLEEWLAKTKGKTFCY